MQYQKVNKIAEISRHILIIIVNSLHVQHPVVVLQARPNQSTLGLHLACETTVNHCGWMFQ